MNGEHGLEPARSEDEIVVEENDEFSSGDGGSVVVGGGVAEITIMQNEADLRIGAKRFKPGAGAVTAAVVDEDDFVSQVGRKAGAERSQHRLREWQAIVEGDDEADLHGVKRTLGRQENFPAPNQISDERRRRGVRAPRPQTGRQTS